MAEYSKGPEGRPASGERLAKILPQLVALGALAGAVLMFVAEFTTLYTVHTASSHAAIRSQGTGGNHGYALAIIAVLAAALAVGVWRTAAESRAVVVAIGALGVVALLIALIGDLPDAQASGVVGSIARGVQPAKATPAVGMYLETLGAVLLIAAAGTGLLLGGGRARDRHVENAPYLTSRSDS